MDTPPANPYQILGLRHDCTPAEVKKRYRELARRYHPDVSQHTDAADRFREITEAHQILTDPMARARVDAAIKHVRTAASRQSSSTNSPHESPAGSQQGSKRSHQSSRTSAPTKNAPPRPTPAQQAAALFEQARQASLRLNYTEAESLCRDAMKLRGCPAGVFELMGDLLKRRGQTEQAIVMYSYALQFEPDNRTAQRKMDKLMGVSSSPTSSRTKVVHSRARSASPLEDFLQSQNFRYSAIGAALIVVLGAVIHSVKRPMAFNGVFIEWDPLLIMSLFCAGLGAGLIAVVNNWIAPISIELGAQGSPGRRSSPLSYVLPAMALIFFFASLAIYVIAAGAQGRISKSIMRIYALSAAVFVLMAACSPVNAYFLLLFGGNLALPGVMVGWALGSMSRR